MKQYMKKTEPVSAIQYVDDNFVKKDTSKPAVQVYGHDAKGNPQMFHISTPNANPNWLCMYQSATLSTSLIWA